MAGGPKLRVFAYYYPWYTGAADDKWAANNEYSPYLGFYDSSDEVVLRRHVEWAIEAGIEGFLVEWRGPDDGIDAPIDACTGALASVLTDYPGFAFAVFYDQVVRFGSPIQLRFIDPLLRAIFVSDLGYAAEKYFSHPNYLRIDGRPVVAIYLTRSASDDYAGLLGAARLRMDAAQAGAPFLVGDDIWWRERDYYFGALDAVTAYSLHTPKLVEQVGGDVRAYMALCADLYARMQEKALEAGSELLPHIGHAYNDGAFRGNPPFIPTHAPGELPQYRGDVIECMKSLVPVWRDNPRFRSSGEAFLFVNSFNEWPERTAVEPSAEIETFNALRHPVTGQYLYLQPHRFEYLYGLRDGRALLEREILPGMRGAR